MDTAGLPKSFMFASGNSWRKGRQVISPSFSALKIKAVSYVVLGH